MSGYHIKIVYEDWTYEIGTSYWAAVDIRNKDAFFGMVLNKINEEYWKRKRK
jgi:hypothetical protein